jgi:hypothetical protein
MHHLTAARRAITSAMTDPDAAPELLDEALGHLDEALAGITQATPPAVARWVVREVEEMFAIMGCFQEEAA